MTHFLIALTAKVFVLKEGFWAENLYTIAVLVFTEIFKITYRAIENAIRNRVGYAYSIFAEFFVKILILVVALNYLNVAIYLVIWAFILANLVSMAFLVRINYLKNWHFSKRFYSVFLKRVLLFSAPLIIWAIFGWARDMSGRWILDVYTSKEEVAAFALMASIAMIGPASIQSLIGAYLVPILYEKENHQIGYTRKVLLKLIPILMQGLLAATALVYLLQEWIVLIIADEKYLEDAWMLPIMFFAYGVFAVAMMSTYEIFAHKQTKLMLWLK